MKRFDPGLPFAKEFIENRMGPMMALKAWYCDNHTRYTTTDNIQPLTLASKQALKPIGFDEKQIRKGIFY